MNNIVTLDVTLLIQAANIIILYFLLRRFLYRPIAEMIVKRRQEVQSHFEKAEQERQQALRERLRYQELYHQVKNSRQEMLAEARRRGSEIVSEAEKEARKKRDTIISRARQEAEQEYRQAEKQLQGQAVAMAIAIAEKILGREAAFADRKALLSGSLELIGRRDNG